MPCNRSQLKFNPVPISKRGVACCIGLSLGALLSSPGYAGEVINQTYTVKKGDAVESWSVRNGVLYVQAGAGTNEISTSGARIHLQGIDGERVSVNGGIVLYDSDAFMNWATVANASGTGLLLGQIQNTPVFGSRATVQSSSISGSTIGVLAGSYGTLNLDNSVVTGTDTTPGAGDGRGIQVAGGDVFVNNGSTVRGDTYGLYIIDGSRGHPNKLTSNATIDNSTIIGGSGPAIKVETFNLGEAPISTIVVRNGSKLISGNGNLLEVDTGSYVDFTVDNSDLTGNLVSDGSGTLNVVLQNNASLTGDMINTTSVAINSGANWSMVKDSSLEKLSMNGGNVRMGSADQFYTLSLDELSGNGTFYMHVDLDDNQGDLLDIKGEAKGNHQLNIQNTGLEPESPEITPLKVVQTGGGDGQFEVVGGSVDLGAYSYQLQQQGDDWFIVGQGKTISPSTQTALALFNVAPTLWYGELATLRSRMGEVRNSGEGGGWMRAYGNQYNVSAPAGFGYKQRQKGLSFGVDLPVSVANGQLLLGVLGGYGKSDLSIGKGSAATVDSYYVGAYGTWLMEDGYYLDAVAKLNRFQNDADVMMTNGTQSKGGYNTFAYGGSLEFGRHINLPDELFVEPFVQMSTVTVLGKEYTLSNGLEAENNRTLSVLGKAGAAFGRTFALDSGGSLKPYLRAAFVHEFSRSNHDVKVNDSRFANDLYGSRGELGAGISASLSEKLQLNADLDYMKGDNIEQPWGTNLTLRYAF